MADGIQVCGHRRFEQAVGDLDAADLVRELRGRDQAAAALGPGRREVRGTAQPGRGALVVTPGARAQRDRLELGGERRVEARARATTRCQVARSGSRAATTARERLVAGAARGRVSTRGGRPRA